MDDQRIVDGRGQPETVTQILRWFDSLPAGSASMVASDSDQFWRIAVTPNRNRSAAPIRILVDTSDDAADGLIIEAGHLYEWLEWDRAEPPETILNSVIAGGLSEDLFVVRGKVVGGIARLHVSPTEEPHFVSATFAPEGILWWLIHGLLRRGVVRRVQYSSY